jgi:glucosamine--fructose-6-phosphate aminotransferase (isomerizing)
MNQVASLGLLAAYVAGKGAEYAGHLRAVSAQLDALIPGLERGADELAAPFSSVERMFVIGRGVEFATAREVALKLLESCRLAAEPLTATDLAHGPFAALGATFPVWTIASNDEMLPAVSDVTERIRKTGATLLACGNAADKIEGAKYRVAVPAAPTPLLSPLLSIVPGQLFAWALAKAKGLDPDKPSGLKKVTLAR